jgi:hypothetical protein
MMQPADLKSLIRRKHSMAVMQIGLRGCFLFVLGLSSTVKILQLSWKRQSSMAVILACRQMTMLEGFALSCIIFCAACALVVQAVC